MSDDEKQEQAPPLIEFPTAFPFKIMGRNDDSFVDHALALVARHTDGQQPTSVASRTSKNDKFLSVTIEITATSRAQLDAIYQTLTDDERVVMAL